MKYSFKNDYSELCHPALLEALLKASTEQNTGYGLDKHTENAKYLIKDKLESDNCDIHFVTGGTQANASVISHILRPYEAVLACSSGHINVHETGAIEATGHKVYTAEGIDGKLTTADIEAALAYHQDEHMVKIGMVYISQSTEIGTVYSFAELKALYELCKEKQLYLYIDGARLSSGLAASDVEFNQLKELCDVMYIGGTKIGMLSGEAIVIFNDQLKSYFRYHIKNKGAMLAKGYVLGIQFEAAFNDNLYFEMGQHENELAHFLSNELKELGIPLLSESPTNQIFPIFTKEQVDELQKNYAFEIWEPVEDKIAIRFVTSWATTKEVCEELIEDIKVVIS
ncbi:aminotransferase class I/II-fold pyridoxal phosphate-dependent enzyme [Ureibacillus chungkukjangi]|uniref:threonine aldolase family protein n=1 Tax=Ureibacillus chungkukjangi TaxID=1202712 RepID=UPI00203B42C1|nr:aminotransferase class I/II-fold pyridoxal phosphate-dependent enzyme [Ureibacillus chungkukjangi]MCM3389650.1 aminotransferase class I/II-fold pyridoxal phosphate-dependent enzyme [Ureibacillus chungkukjangi]